MVQSNKYYKSRTVGVTSEVDLTTDRDLAEPLCLRKMTSFIATQYRKSCGTSHYTTQIVKVLAIQAKFLEPSVYWTVINCTSNIYKKIFLAAFMTLWPNSNSLSKSSWIRQSCTLSVWLTVPSWIEVILFTNPSARAGYDTRSIFKRSLTGLNSEFSFS